MLDLDNLRKKMLQWAVAGLGFMIIFMCLVMVVVAPVIWAATLVNKISGSISALFDNNTTITDYRELLDAEGASSRKAFSYAEFLSCTMNDGKDGNVGACLLAIGNDGEFSEDVDISYSAVYRVHASVNEYKGALPNSGYEDLWVPTLFHRMHYREVQVLDPETGDVVESRWVYDFTEETIYKDSCEENAPETVCEVFREGFWTYPFINVAGEGTVPTQRYGYDVSMDNNALMTFLTGVEYGANDLKSMSSGMVESVGADELGGSQVTLHISHNGLDFYIRYRRLSSVKVSAGHEVEIKEEIGHSDNSLIETYMLIDGEEQYFNPYLLYGDVVFLEGDGNSGVFTGNQGTMSAAEVGEALSGLSWSPPFEYRITANFAAQGIKVWGANGHNGIDLVPASGQQAGHEILCGMEGIVTGQGYNSISGNYIEVQSASNPRVAVRYCHMLKPASYSKGAAVTTGVVLGYVGSTGASTGPHTHVSLVIDGNFYNPNLLYRF